MKNKFLIFALSALIVLLLGGCSQSGATPTRVDKPNNASNPDDLFKSITEEPDNKDSDKNTPSKKEEVEDITSPEKEEAKDITPTEKEEAKDITPTEKQASKDNSSIDLDLTELSSTMVYAEVFNIIMRPDEYIGKIVKMNGLFSLYHDEATGNNYYACIIQDATACCAEGIEFVLKEQYVYPDDYPAEGEDITVVGTFDTYTEGEYTYCTLRNADIVKP